MCDFVVNELGPEVPLHFSRAFPYYKMNDISPTNTETLFKAKEIALKKEFRMFIWAIFKNIIKS